MPNNYFRFRQFIVRQDACAMKVCTDSCVLGAFAGSEILKRNLSPEHILDIGGGTGLLSLMIAQKSYALIDAIEIAEPCFLQMAANFKISPWHDRLIPLHGDIREWSSVKKYDFIISNPPFFEHDLKGTNELRTMAMHDSGLLLNDVPGCIRSHIAAEGFFCVMVPANRSQFFEKALASNNAFITSVLALKHNNSKPPFRMIYFGNFHLPSLTMTRSELVITAQNDYTEEFKILLRDYYLNL